MQWSLALCDADCLVGDVHSWPEVVDWLADLGGRNQLQMCEPRTTQHQDSADKRRNTSAHPKSFMNRPTDVIRYRERIGGCLLIHTT